jgi:hypothetical protein
LSQTISNTIAVNIEGGGVMNKAPSYAGLVEGWVSEYGSAIETQLRVDENGGGYKKADILGTAAQIDYAIIAVLDAYPHLVGAGSGEYVAYLIIIDAGFATNVSSQSVGTQNQRSALTSQFIAKEKGNVFLCVVGLFSPYVIGIGGEPEAVPEGIVGVANGNNFPSPQVSGTCFTDY